MRISSKCSLALHILLLLAVYKHDKLTSEIMASSTGCNPAMIRDMMKKLREAGLIETTRGTGGSRLIKDPKDITIWTVYCAADPDSFQNCIALHKNPYEGCPVGRCITPVLSPIRQHKKRHTRSHASRDIAGNHRRLLRYDR